MKRGLAFSAWVAVLIAGLWFALRPIDRSSGRFFFLPPRWAEWLDFNDWAVNFAAFGLFAWLTMIVFGILSKRWTAAATLVLLPAGIVVIEWLQAEIPGRLVDVTDVVAGVAGTVAGVMIAALQNVKTRG